MDQGGGTAYPKLRQLSAEELHDEKLHNHRGLEVDVRSEVLLSAFMSNPGTLSLQM